MVMWWLELKRLTNGWRDRERGGTQGEHMMM